MNFVILKISQFDWKNYELLTLSPRSKISSAFGPLTVQWTAIFSLRRIPKERTVYLALEKTGCWPVKDSNTCKKINFECSESFKFLDPFLESFIQSVSLKNLQFTFAALVSLSPDSPTQMFKQSLRILVSRMGFFALASLTILDEMKYISYKKRTSSSCCC